MNAKMVITVPIESVPKKISELISGLSDNLDNLSNKLEFCSRNILNEDDLLKEIENLDKFRQELSLIDTNIEDCYGILKGYVNYKHPLNKQETENTSNDSNINK